MAKSAEKQKETQRANGLKLRNGDVWQGVNALAVLGGRRFHVLTSLEIARYAKHLAELRKPIEEARVALVAKYAMLDEHGKQLKEPNGGVKLTDSEAFAREFNELMDANMPADGLQPLKLPATEATICEKCKHNNLSPFEIEPAVLLQLLPFLATAGKETA